MILRILAGLAFLAGIGAATHANIMHAGGYSSPDAPLIIAVAAALTFGMAFAGAQWNEGRRLAAMFLALCLTSGEVYWLGTNAEREFSSREATFQVLDDAIAMKTKLQTRLDDAQRAKAEADAASISEAAKPGCRSQCRILLEGTAKTANEDLARARAAFDALPTVHAGARLPDKLGVAAWAFDVIMAGLRSLAVMGCSIGLGLVLHPKRQREARREAPPKTIDVTPTPAKLNAPLQSIGKVDEFLARCVWAANGSRVALDDIYIAYQRWCSSASRKTLAPALFVKELATICEQADVKIDDAGGRVHLLDVKLAA